MDQSRKDKISKVINKAYENQALRNYLIEVGKRINNSQAKVVILHYWNKE